ncbi:hypothetical protein GGR52DRAFT_565721 [Hypoxylon sp. FL1284]|nr:hypothetical protein GGR52DRAFT_565721 [Hypoxylon sp. FL1284]
MSQLLMHTLLYCVGQCCACVIGSDAAQGAMMSCVVPASVPVPSRHGRPWKDPREYIHGDASVAIVAAICHVVTYTLLCSGYMGLGSALSILAST